MNENLPDVAAMQRTKLISFRQAVYDRLGPARDAVFELCDAVLLSAPGASFVSLSLSPVFRRRWSSVYAALQDGRPDPLALLQLYRTQVPPAWAGRPVLAGDHTAWPRVTAQTLRDRSVQHQPTRSTGHRPITSGHGYSTLALVPEAEGSWALPLLHERIASSSTPLEHGAAQLAQVCALLHERPITVWDSEYGCAVFVQATATLPADKILRLRTRLVLRGTPPPYAGRGRRPIHGRVFKLHVDTTWGAPDEWLETTHPQYGPVRVQCWHALHFPKTPAQPMHVARVERLGARGTRRAPTVLWLAWVGGPPPPLTKWWTLYLRRFTVDHWYRFAKQRLGWRQPHVQTPERGERWSTLMPLVTWHRWLAREAVADCPLPWQQAQPRARTPGRVCQGLGPLFARIGTPTGAPHRRGKAPGWQRGTARKHKPWAPVVTKGTPPRTKQAKRSAKDA